MKEFIVLFIAFAIFLYGVFALLRDVTKKIITFTAEIKKEKRKEEVYNAKRIECYSDGDCSRQDNPN